MTDERDDRSESSGADFTGEGEVEILGFESEAERAATAPEAEPEAGLAPAPAGEAEAAAELARVKDRYLRLLADFDNYRKRTERERSERLRFAFTEPLRELLPVVDNLERALTSPGEAEDLKRGVEMVVRQFLEVLRRYGVEPVLAVGQRFDPALHEAVLRVESDDVETPTVIEELQRGYRIHDRLLRPAMVRVAVPPEPDGEGEPGDGGEA